MGFMCPGCGCSTCTCVFNFTLVGCNSIALGAGYGYTITQSGVTLATGTTNSAGSMGSVTVHSTANVTVTVTSISSRFASTTTILGPVCGSTFNVNVAMTVATGYACAPVCYFGQKCAYPIAKTLHLTTPSGNTIALGWFHSSFGDTWFGGETLSVSPTCNFGSTPGAVTFTWSFPSGVTANVCVSAGHNTCSLATCPQACTDSFAGGTSGCGDGTGTQSSFSCYDPNLPSAFSATGTFSNMYFSGSWTLTE